MELEFLWLQCRVRGLLEGLGGGGGVVGMGNLANLVNLQQSSPSSALLPAAAAAAAAADIISAAWTSLPVRRCTSFKQVKGRSKLETPNYLRGTLRSWGHLSFNYYLVKTDPMLHIFGSKIISLTFIDILNANLSEIETL